jgi:prepilin-type N-terminal cleavage/methylation domain-containing protein
MKYKKHGAGGYTLVELVVTIAVAGIFTLALTNVVTNYLHLWQRGRYLSLSSEFVESKVEALRNNGYNELILGSTNISNELPSQLPPQRSASMAVTSPSDGLKQVDITVTYKDQGQDNSYSYTTYMGELGVGQ